MIIWINFDIDFRVYIFELKFDTQFKTFLNQFNEKINIWHDLKIVKRSNMFINNVDRNNRFINKQNQTQKRQNEFSQSFENRFVSQFLYFFANWYYNSNSIYQNQNYQYCQFVENLDYQQRFVQFVIVLSITKQSLF